MLSRASAKIVRVANFNFSEVNQVSEYPCSSRQPWVKNGGVSASSWQSLPLSLLFSLTLGRLCHSDNSQHRRQFFNLNLKSRSSSGSCNPSLTSRWHTILVLVTSTQARKGYYNPSHRLTVQNRDGRRTANNANDSTVSHETAACQWKRHSSS